MKQADTHNTLIQAPTRVSRDIYKKASALGKRHGIKPALIFRKAIEFGFADVERWLSSFNARG